MLHRFRLWPVSSNKLVLEETISRRSAKVFTKEVGSQPRCTLLPLALPAIHVAPFAPSLSEQYALISSFSGVLGSSRSPSPVYTRLENEQGNQQSEWGVYWVNIPKQSEASSDSKPPQGVLIVWPTSLVSYDTISQSTAAGQQPVPAYDFPTPDSMMDVSTGLFDFMTSYSPPTDPVESTPESQPPMERESTGPINSRPASKSPSSGGSDFDDLFEDRSDDASPVPEVAPAASSDEPSAELPVEAADGLHEVIPEDGSMDTFGAFDFPSQIELDADIVMSSPGPDDDVSSDSPQRQRTGDPIRRVLEEADVPPVTEDDFNFFDSPGEEDPSVGVNFTIPPIAEALVLSPQATAQAAEPTPQPTEAHSPVDPGTKHAEPQPSTEHQPTPNSPEPLPLPSVQVVDFDSATPEKSSSPPLKIKTTSILAQDLIPSAFAPLPDLAPLSSFAYSLPTPSSTPEPLRPGLLDRLKTKETYDYSASWDVESVDESMDEFEEYTGAPPTPVSFIDTETQPSLLPSPKPDGTDGATDISWEGVPLIGADLLKVQWDRKALDGVARGWNESWLRDKSKSAQPVRPSSSTRPCAVLENVDMDRLVEEVVTNRFLRSLLKHDTEVNHYSDDVSPELELGKSSPHKRICLLTTGTETKALSHCTIHAGLANNIAKISVASLRYWRQLGLQPSGGRKDVTAYVVCEVGAGITRAATTFLQSVGEAYGGCLLGTHTAGQAGASRGGVVSVPSAGYIDCICELY